MLTIKNKPKSPKTIWDAEKGQPLLVFKDGCFTTNDSEIAKKAKELGYEVTGKVSKQSKDDEKNNGEQPETDEQSEDDKTEKPEE